MMRERPKRRRLRKQPRVRRVQAAPALTMPRMRVPETARKRRQRNTRRLRFPTAALKRIVLSARWVSLLLCALSIWALAMFGLDESFYVTFIPVDGVASLSAEEVVEASEMGGTHVFALDPHAAASRVAQLPGVISATVSLNWPNDVQISMREEPPVALWQDGEQQYWISESGHVLPARMPVEGLLVIEVEDTAGTEEAGTGAAETAGLPFIPPEALAGALQLQTLRPNLQQLYYSPGSGLSFVDGEGWRAYFGVGEDMERRLIVYETIVNELRARGETPLYISVSNQEKPFYRVRSGQNGG